MNSKLVYAERPFPVTRVIGNDHGVIADESLDSFVERNVGEGPSDRRIEVALDVDLKARQLFSNSGIGVKLSMQYLPGSLFSPQ